MIDVLLFSPFAVFSLFSIAHRLSPVVSPATRRLRSGRQRCGGRGDNQIGSFVDHLLTTAATDL